MNKAYAAALLLLALAGCAHHVAPPAPGGVKYTVGQPYQAGGEWFYPREFNAYDATGLAIVITDHDAAYTADNERYDPNALAAASPVLQLPCIVTVTNLANGRMLDVRVNERGPMQPGRILAVTPRVAQLLGFPPGGVVEVEVKLNQSQSAALQSTLGAVPKLTAAPVAGITAQSLPPPGRGGAGAAQQLIAMGNENTAPEVTLSGQIFQAQPNPGPLWVRVPGFGSEHDAFRAMMRVSGLPARVKPQLGGERVLWAVEIGPYHSVAAADEALRQVLQAGVADPEIIVR